MSFEQHWSEDDANGGALVAQFKAIALNPRGLLRRRWMWMTTSFFIGILVTAGVYLTLKPMYAAVSTVLVSNQQIPEEFVRSTVSGLDSLSNINAMAGEILSYNNLSRMIEEHDLYTELDDALELSEIIAIMRQSIFIRPGEDVGGGSRRMQENASIFLIEYASEDPMKAAVVANDLSAGFIDSSIRRRNQQARTTTEFMERELARADTELRNVKALITKFQQNNRGSMPRDQETILRKLERLEAHRQNLNMQIMADEERLAALRSETNTNGAISPETRLADMKLELVSQVALRTNEHPSVVALRRQIRQLESELGDVKQIFAQTELAHANRVSVSLRSIENLRLELREIDQEMEELDLRALKIPSNTEAFEALSQNSRVLEEKYLEFLRKVQDAKLAEELERSQQGPRVTVLDHASPPTDPIRSSARYLQFGLAASFALAILAAMLAELIDPTILDPDHFAYIGDAPMLGSIYSF